LNGKGPFGNRTRRKSSYAKCPFLSPLEGAAEAEDRLFSAESASQVEEEVEVWALESAGEEAEDAASAISLEEAVVLA